MTEKRKRIVNRELLDYYHQLPCVVCHCYGTTVAHHIKTKGAGGDDSVENLIPLCTSHHQEIHNIGRDSMLERYQFLDGYLKRDK